jgi:N-acetylmuramoyl-L-alanine amidase
VRKPLLIWLAFVLGLVLSISWANHAPARISLPPRPSAPPRSVKAQLLSAGGSTVPGFEVAFQANTGALWTVGSALNQNWSLGMMPGTSPTIAALAGGGFEVAFQANTGALWTVGSALNQNLNLGMKAGTSPTIAATGPLAGKVIAVDPGHNGGNAAAPGVIDQLVWNGTSTSLSTSLPTWKLRVGL